ncbi:MAG TPA: hypothetical protein VF881_05880 [Polyangiaceae bacterium]
MAVLLLLGFLFAKEARADVSSWFYVGGGMTALSAEQRPGTLQAELGMGSTPSAMVIVGGLMKTLTFFGHGSDLALVARMASGGFVRGGFGFALDGGGYQRWWGESSTGLIGALVLGAPFGIQVTGMTERGSNDVRTYGATVGIDFLRLTVYRTTATSYWPNTVVPPLRDGSR